LAFNLFSWGKAYENKFRIKPSSGCLVALVRVFVIAGGKKDEMPKM
jgi:hypothetical protein